MSGYLRRLALRTLRATPTVHSAASLPYATWSWPEPPVFDSPSGIDDPAIPPRAETVPSPIPDRRIQSLTQPTAVSRQRSASPMPDRRAQSQIGPRSAFDAAAASMRVAGPEPVATRSAGLAEAPPEVDPGSPLPAQEARAEPSSPPEVPARRSTPAFDRRQPSAVSRQPSASPMPDRRAPSQIGPRSAFDAAAASMRVAGPEPVATGPAGLAQDPPELDPGSPLPAQEARAEPSSPPEVPAGRSTPAFDPGSSIPQGRQEPDWAALDPGPAILVPRRGPADLRGDRRPLPAPDWAAPPSPGAPAVSRAPSSRVLTDGASTPVGLGSRDRRDWAARSAGEPTEVHVRIGRIEITAVQDAPPPKRQAAKANKPMTLDEYLARRQGRRPGN